MGRKKKDKVEEKEVITTRTPRKWNPVSREMIESSEDEEEDPEICPVCSEKNDPTNPGDKKNRMIGCDSCDKWYHWSCVGIDHENKPGKDDDWYCRKCTARRGEAGEWKPEKGEQGLLDILPIRESTRVSSPQGTPNHQKNGGRGRGRGRGRGTPSRPPNHFSTSRHKLTPSVTSSEKKIIRQQILPSKDEKRPRNLFADDNETPPEPAIKSSGFSENKTGTSSDQSGSFESVTGSPFPKLVGKKLEIYKVGHPSSPTSIPSRSESAGTPLSITLISGRKAGRRESWITSNSKSESPEPAQPSRISGSREENENGQFGEITLEPDTGYDSPVSDDSADEHSVHSKVKEETEMPRKVLPSSLLKINTTDKSMPSSSSSNSTNSLLSTNCSQSTNSLRTVIKIQNDAKKRKILPLPENINNRKTKVDENPTSNKIRQVDVRINRLSLHDKRISLDDRRTPDTDEDKSKLEVERELINGSDKSPTIPPMIPTPEIVPSIPTHDSFNTTKRDTAIEPDATMNPGSPMEPETLLNPVTQDVGILDESVPELSQQIIASRSRRETRNKVPIRYASSSDEEDPRIVSAKKRNTSPRLTKPPSGSKSPKSLEPAPKSPDPVVDIALETITEGDGTKKRKRTEPSDSSDSSELRKKIKSGVSILNFDLDSRNAEDIEKERNTNEPDNAKEVMMEKEIDEEETINGRNKNTNYNEQLNEVGDSMNVDLGSNEISLESCLRIDEGKETANKEDSVASSKPVTPPQKKIESNLDRNLDDMNNQYEAKELEPQEKLVCASVDPRNQGQNENIPEIPARKDLRLASPGLFSDFVNPGQAGPDKISLDLNLTEDEIRSLPVDIFTRKPDDQDTFGREMEELINGTEPVKDLVASKSISEIQKELEGFGQKDPMPMLIPNWNSSRYSQGDHLSGQSNPQIGIPSPSALVPTRVSTQVPSHGNHSLPHVITGSPLKTGSRLIKISELSNIQRLTNPEVQADGQEHRAQIKILNPTKLNLKASQVHNNRVFSPKERISVARRPSMELPLRQFQVAGADSSNRFIRVSTQLRYSNPSILGTSIKTLPEANNVTTNTLSGTSTNSSSISATEYLYPLNAKLQSVVSVPNPTQVLSSQHNSTQPTTAHQQVMNPVNIQQLVNQETIQHRSDPSYLIRQTSVPSPSYQTTTMHHPNQPQTASLPTSQTQFPNHTNSIGVQQYAVQARPPLPTPQSNIRVQTTLENVQRIHVNSYQATEGNFYVQGSPVPRSVHSVVLSSGFGGQGQLQEGLNSNVTHINGPAHYRVSTGNGQITPVSGSFSVSQPLPTPINVRPIGDLGHPLASSQPTRAPQPSSAVMPEAIRPLAGAQPQRLKIRGGTVRLPGGVRAPRIPGQENQRMGMVRGGPWPRMRSQGPRPAGRFPRPPGPPPTQPSLGPRPPIGSPAGEGIPRSPARHQSPRPSSHQNTTPPKPAKSPPSVIKIEDDEPEIIELIDEPPTPLKSATIDRLKAGGISVTRQAPPKIPKGLKLPPGISLSPAGSHDGRGRSSGSSEGRRGGGESRIRRELNPPLSREKESTPQKKVQVELSEEQYEKLKSMGVLN